MTASSVKSNGNPGRIAPPSPDAPAVSIIIPTYNESAIIEGTLDALVAALDRDFGGGYELLFVDDGSRDGTADLLAALVAERAKLAPAGAFATGRVLVLSYPQNRGKGYAVRYGMLRARGEKRVFTDADLAYGTEVLSAVAERLAPENAILTAPVCSETGENAENAENAEGTPCDPPAKGVGDMVIGSRDLHEDGYRGYTPLRRFISRSYRAVLRGFFGLSVTDSQCGIKGFTAAAAERIFREAETDRYAFDFEIITLAARAGLRIEELPVCIVNNRKSRIRLFRDSTRMLRDVLATRRRLKKNKNTPKSPS